MSVECNGSRTTVMTSELARRHSQLRTMERGGRRLLPVPAKLGAASKSQPSRSESRPCDLYSNSEYPMSNPGNARFGCSIRGQSLDRRLPPVLFTGKSSSSGNLRLQHTGSKGFLFQPVGSGRAAFPRARERHAALPVVLIVAVCCLVFVGDCGDPTGLHHGVSPPHSSQMVSPGQPIPASDLRQSAFSHSFSSPRPSQSSHLQQGAASLPVATSAASTAFSHPRSQLGDAVHSNRPSSVLFSRDSCPPQRCRLLSRASPLLSPRAPRSRSVEKAAFLSFPATAVSHLFSKHPPSAVNRLLSCRSRKSLSPDVCHGIRGRHGFFRGEDLWCRGWDRLDSRANRGGRHEFDASREGVMTQSSPCPSTAVGAASTVARECSTPSANSADQHAGPHKELGSDPLADYVRRHG